MTKSRVVVVYHEDLEFKDSVGSFLADHFQIDALFCEFLTGDVLSKKNRDIYLVNSDPFGADKTLAQSFRALTYKIELKAKKAIFMLTRNFNARDFLRDQEMSATDTVDISGGLSALKIALARHLLEKQLELFKGK
jgi:hypothetical protein